jgi:hypothetical protein
MLTIVSLQARFKKQFRANASGQNYYRRQEVGRRHRFRLLSIVKKHQGKESYPYSYLPNSRIHWRPFLIYGFGQLLVQLAIHVLYAFWHCRDKFWPVIPPIIPPAIVTVILAGGGNNAEMILPAIWPVPIPLPPAVA